MMVQSTRKKNRFEDFVANEHAELPGYVHEDQEDIRKQRKKKLIDKHFRVTPEASQYTGTGPQLGPVLIAEALNLLFEKYGMEQVA